MYLDGSKKVGEVLLQLGGGLQDSLDVVTSQKVVAAFQKDAEHVKGELQRRVLHDGPVGGVLLVPPQLGLLDHVHVEGHDLHQTVLGERQRRLADEHPELLQQARRGQGEVVGVDVSVELALEVEECVEETAVEVRDRE